MNPPPSSDLIQAGLSGVITYELLGAIAARGATTPPKALEELALHVAQEYSNGRLSFEEADSIMNAAFAVATSAGFWAAHDRSVPSMVFEVYQAFDEGEYHHPGDAPGIEPELKYTRPLVERFLAAHKNGA